MYYIDDILLTNFRSHQSTKCVFPKKGTVLVYGVNHDEPDESDSNGTGKSSMLLGTTIALIGFPDKELTKDDYVMDGAKFTEITMNLSNPVYKKKLHIYRKIYRNTKSSEIQIYENGELNTQVTGWDDGNNKILELLGLTKEDLLNYYLINQSNNHSFFRIGDNDKKRMISRFTNTGMVDNVLKVVISEHDELEEKIDELNQEILLYDERIKVLEEQITYEEKQRIIDKRAEKKEAKKEIKKLKGEINTYKEKRNTLHNTISAKNVELDKINDSVEDDEVFLIQKKKLNLEVSQRNSRLKETETIIGQINTFLAGEIVCPKCDHKFFVSDKDADIIEWEKLKKTTVEHKDNLDKEINKLKKNIDKIEEKRGDNKKIKTSIDNINDRLESLEIDLSDADERVIRKRKDIKLLRSKIVRLSETRIDLPKVLRLQEEIDGTKFEKSKFVLEIDKLERELEDVIFWKVNFSEVGFKTFLVNKVLNNIEGHVNYQLGKLSNKLMVKINGYTKLKGGGMREKIETLITKNGGDSWSKYNRFSGGQKGRVDVSGILAFHNLINSSSEFGGLAFCGMDEVFDGLDTKGQKMILPLLDRAGIPIMVISHNNNDIGAIDTLIVDYKDEISTIRQNNTINE